MMKLLSLLLFIAFLSNILMTTALKCYQCWGNKPGMNCNDPTSESSPETCETDGSCFWGTSGLLDGALVS